MDRPEGIDLIERLLEAVRDSGQSEPAAARLLDLTRQVPSVRRDWSHVELRATIRKGQVTVTFRDNALAEGGPLAVYARAAVPPDVSIANVTFDDEAEPDDREVEVDFLANDNSNARRALERWATAAGHARVWFSDEVFDPDPADAPTGRATTSCRTCDLEMTDGSEDFWDMVRDCGMFPPYCFSCGSTVPQWSTEAVAKPRRGHLEIVTTAAAE